MQNVQDCYAGLSHHELYERWSTKYLGAAYTEKDLEAIHRRWKSLGKKVTQGPAVRLDLRKRR
jgi:hypothetical protein